jgi:hypothetical protein
MEDENNKFIRYDGFDGFESGYETGDDDEGVHALRGSLLAGTTRISFTNEAQWIEAVAKKILPIGFELLLVNVERVVVCWEGQKPEQRVLGPGEKFPNVKKLNEGVPKSKWRTDLNGNLVGPYQAQHVLFLLDEKTLDRYSWPTSTIGGSICVQDIVSKVNWKRRYHGGQHVLPRVLLADTFMKTRYSGARGGRQRPHLIVKEWIILGGGGSPLPAAQPAPQLSGPTSAAAAAPAPNTAKKVEERPLTQEMNDSIPFKQGVADMKGHEAASAASSWDDSIEGLIGPNK